MLYETQSYAVCSAFSHLSITDSYKYPGKKIQDKLLMAAFGNEVLNRHLREGNNCGYIII